MPIKVGWREGRGREGAKNSCARNTTSLKLMVEKCCFADLQQRKENSRISLSPLPRPSRSLFESQQFPFNKISINFLFSAFSQTTQYKQQWNGVAQEVSGVFRHIDCF
jgi:hypothetical protein